jgi:heme A synthase
MVVHSHLLAALVLLAASATASGGGWHEHQAKAKARLELVRAALGASLVDSVAAELGAAVVVRASAGGAWGSHRQCSRWSCG